MSEDVPAAARERGGIIVGGLLRIVAVLLVLGVVIYEAGAVAINHVQLDTLAGEAVQEGASTPPSQRTVTAVERSVRAVLDGSGANITTLDVDRDGLRLTIERRANVLLLHRLGPVADLADASVTKEAAFR